MSSKKEIAREIIVAAITNPRFFDNDNVKDKKIDLINSLIKEVYKTIEEVENN